jgi:hypothetical protein
MSKVKKSYDKMMALAKEAEKPMRAVKVKNIGDISDSLLPSIKEIKTSLDKLDLNVDFKEVTTAIEKLKKSMDSMEMNPTFKPEFKPTFKVENKMDQLNEVLSSLKDVKKAIDSIKLPDHSKELQNIRNSVDSIPSFPDVVKGGRIKVEVDRTGEYHGIVPFESSNGQTKKALVDVDGHLQVDSIGVATEETLQAVLEAQGGSVYNYIQSETGATYKYYGYASSTGWKFKRKTLATGVWEVADGTGDYDTAWADKSSKSYSYV